MQLMPIYRAQVVIPADSGVSKDACVNNWGFFTADTSAALVTAITTPLKNFYDSWANYRAGLMAWTGTRMKVYNLSDPLPRVPVADITLGLSSAEQTTNLPGECALCLSFQAQRISGQSQARRRGRVYLGPFGSVANVSSTGRPDSTMITTILAGAEALRTAMGSTIASWVVISQPKPTMPITSSVVTGGWIDNAWDTQRRRGLQPLTRTVFGT